MSRDFLPRQDVPLTDGSNRTTTPFYLFLLGLERAVANGSVTPEEFATLVARVTALEDADPFALTIVGLGSILVQGTVDNGFIQITLQGDENDPGIRYRYGTDASGQKGWARLFEDFEAGIGLIKTDSGYEVLGEVDTSADLPPTGNLGEAYRVLDPDEFGLWAWDGVAWALDAAADSLIGFQLAELPNSGAGALLAITRDAYGRAAGTKDATITGTAGQIEVTNGNAVAGLPTISLADVADGGGGTLQRTAFDEKGRKTGTSEATTTDLPEGSNLYFTAQRVRDTLLTGLSLASSAVIAATDSVLSAFGKIQAQITALAASLSGYAPTSRTISTTAPLTGGGDLSADRTFAISAATTGAAGSMSAADKSKLDGIAPGAQPGTVTSVAVANATGITWEGSPITGSGTLTPTLSENLQAWSGLATSEKEDAFSKGTLIQGSGVTLTGTLTNRLVGSGDVTVAATGGGSGTVTSVGLSLPAIFDVTGSPVTTSGTLSGSFLSQSANRVLASPDGGPGTPAFRTLTVSDGATGFTTYTLGDLLVGASSGALARLSAGASFTSLTISSPGDIGWNKIDLTNGVTGKLLGANIEDNAVTNDILRDSAALSVIGRSANSTGNPADMAAGTDGHVLRRSGTGLGFGTVATAGIANDAITNAKLANMVAGSVKMRVTASTGDPEDATPAQFRTAFNLTDSGWTAPTLGSSWVDYGGAYIVAGYRKIGSDVTLRGIIKSGTTTDGTTLFTLPTGFRPTATRWFLCGGGAEVDGAGYYNIQVTSAGAVQIVNLTLNGFVSLDGVSFHID